MSIFNQPRIKVHSVWHLHDLLRRGKSCFRVEAVVQPSRELRGQDLSGVHRPTEILAANDHSVISNCFGYDCCLLVLSDPNRYEATIYCYGAWNAHDEAEETAKWA